MLSVLTDGSTREDSSSMLDEICREGARRMLAAALEAEVDAYIESHTGELDEDGHRLVVRNGQSRAREVATVAGKVEVEPHG